MEEVWKDVVGYEGIYEVSSIGNVKSLNYYRKGTPRLLKLTVNVCGYPVFSAFKDGKKKQIKVHRAVAEAFLKKPDGKDVVDHINTIRNDNRVENLRWVTTAENCGNEITRKHHSDEKIGNTNGFKKGVFADGARTAIENKKRPVVCITTMETFGSIKDASRAMKQYGVNSGALGRTVKKLDGREHCGSIKKGEKTVRLEWRYA